MLFSYFKWLSLNFTRSRQWTLLRWHWEVTELEWRTGQPATWLSVPHLGLRSLGNKSGGSIGINEKIFHRRGHRKGELCGCLLDTLATRSTYSSSLHMTHLLLYGFPSAPRTGSLSRVQLSCPFFMLSQYWAHSSWKGRRKQAMWAVFLFPPSSWSKHYQEHSFLLPLQIAHDLGMLSTEKRGARVIRVLIMKGQFYST